MRFCVSQRRVSPRGRATRLVAERWPNMSECIEFPSKGALIYAAHARDSVCFLLPSGKRARGKSALFTYARCRVPERTGDCEHVLLCTIRFLVLRVALLFIAKL